MSAILVAEAIYNRLKADTGTGGLYSASGGTTWLTTITTGAYGVVGTPSTLVPPYMVFSVAATPAEAEDTMNGDGFRFTVTIQHFEDANRGTDALRAGFNRLYGDAALQSTRRPTYGLHRHLLVLDTDSTKNPLGWKGGDVTCISQSVSPVDEKYHMAEIVFETRAFGPEV